MPDTRTTPAQPWVPAATRVAVVGSGLEAPLCALVLAAQGLATQLLRAPASRPGHTPRPRTLGPNAMRILQAIGLRSAVEDAAFLPQRIDFRAWRSGFIVGHRPLGALAVARHGAPHCVIADLELDRLLTEALADRHIDTVEAVAVGPDPTAAAADPESIAAGGSTVTVLCGPDEDLPTPALRQLASDLAGAALRPPQSYTHRWFTPADTVPEPAPAVSHWMGPGCAVTLTPCTVGGRLLGTECRVATGAAEATAIPDLLQDAHPLLRAHLQHGSYGGSERLGDGSAARAWFRSLTVLLGRCVQRTAPELDQDLALALEDAWVLGSLLDNYDDAPALALEDYRNARLQRRQRVARAGLELRALLMADSRATRWRRDLRLAVEARLLPEYAQQQIDWLYGYNLPARFY